jgi:hypothetical protein
MIRPLLLLCAVGAAAPLVGQEDACRTASDPSHAGWCREVALGLQAAQGDLALLNSGGVDLPGASSTLGKRVGAGPRFSFSGRMALVGFEAPDLSDPGAAPVPGSSAVAPALHGAFALGVFRGFAPSPTVGGVLALDVLASGNLLFPPGSLGYEGTEVGYGLGVRLGVFRESFTLPGITVTATQRWVQGVDVGEVGSTGSTISFDLATSSVRAVIGKDLWGFGFLGGIGWDRSSSDGTVPLPDGGTTRFEDASDTRSLLFGGISWSHFVVQVSGEVGWASGWDNPAGRPSGGYDPASGRWFGGLAVRLIY